MLTFKPVLSGRRKVLLIWIHSLLQQCVRGWRGGGSIIWLYNYPSEQNALFVLIWSIGDTDPYWASTSSHSFLISAASDERLYRKQIFEFTKKIYQNRVNEDVVSLPNYWTCCQRMKKEKAAETCVFSCDLHSYNLICLRRWLRNSITRFVRALFFSTGHGSTW